MLIEFLTKINSPETVRTTVLGYPDVLIPTLKSKILGSCLISSALAASSKTSLDGWRRNGDLSLSSFNKRSNFASFDASKISIAISLLYEACDCESSVSGAPILTFGGRFYEKYKRNSIKLWRKHVKQTNTGTCIWQFCTYMSHTHYTQNSFVQYLHVFAFFFFQNLHPRRRLESVLMKTCVYECRILKFPFF